MGRRSLLKTERKDPVKGILRLERQLDGRRVKLEEIDADRLRPKPPREAKLHRTPHQNGTGSHGSRRSWFT
jgi:hypothetical protein